MTPTTRGTRSIQRILDAAARMFGREGFRGASMNAVARAAGVSKGLLHYHFQSKEHLLIEAVRATFRQLHRRFDERFQRGERGLGPTVEALDALWDSVYDMRSWAPFMIETVSLGAQPGPLRDDLFAFYAESEAMLIDGIGELFDGEQLLQLPPDRVARLVRVCLHGLVVDLSYARSDDDLAEVQRAYEDLRALFARLAEHDAAPDPPEESP